MIFFEWSDNYSVGNEEIDSQHQNLFAFLNKYYEAMTKGRGREEIDAIFAEMKAYALYHFQSEERKMQEAGYPELENHKRVHSDFVAKILEFEEKKKAGDLLVTVNVAKFLNTWLRQHILGDDKKYAPYISVS